jgi:hypothetical protein
MSVRILRRLRGEVADLTETRDFLLEMVERAACGCLGRDCTVHGAYDSGDLESSRKLRDLQLERLKRLNLSGRG